LQRALTRPAVVFPGQGTQAPGMAAPWRDHPAWAVVERAEKALGEPLAHLVTDAPAEALTRTREAQLAVLLTSLVVWEAARDRVHDPVAFAGHSLGQVTALIASDTLALEDGVQFAARRAELTQQAADRHPGRMAALLGATPEQAAEACSAAPDACWIANDNAPGQVVVAGTPGGVATTGDHARTIGIRRVTPLNVGGAFHTPLMQDASDALVDTLREVDLRTTAAPVVSNTDARAYTDGDGWRARLASHVSVPVRWRESQETLASLGATALLEVGHGSMLAALAKRTVPDLPVVGVATPDDLSPLVQEST
jgi:[acyl-carrier-protein] S-malonyltransferase